jgi:hypothetical protein
MVSSEIDIGIWRSDMTNIPIKTKDTDLEYKAEMKFYSHEINFFQFFELDLLKEHFESIDYIDNDYFLQTLNELCIHVPTILIMLNRLDEALELIKRSLEIANYYGLDYLKAKALIVFSSIMIKQQSNFFDV